MQENRPFPGIPELTERPASHLTCMVLFHLVWVAIRAGQEESCSHPGFLTPFPHRSFSASAELAQQILARMTVQKMGKLSPFFHISLPYMGLAQTSSPPARAGSREKRFGKAKPFMVASALPALLFIQTTHTRWKRTTCIIHKPDSIWGEGRNGLAPEVPLWSLHPSRPSPLEHSWIPSLQHKIYE